MRAKTLLEMSSSPAARRAAFVTTAPSETAGRAAAWGIGRIFLRKDYISTISGGQIEIGGASLRNRHRSRLHCADGPTEGVPDEDPSLARSPRGAARDADGVLRDGIRRSAEHV